MPSSMRFWFFYLGSFRWKRLLFKGRLASRPLRDCQKSPKCPINPQIMFQGHLQKDISPKQNELESRGWSRIFASYKYFQTVSKKLRFR